MRCTTRRRGTDHKAIVFLARTCCLHLLQYHVSCSDKTSVAVKCARHCSSVRPPSLSAVGAYRQAEISAKTYLITYTAHCLLHRLRACVLALRMWFGPKCRYSAMENTHRSGMTDEDRPAPLPPRRANWRWHRPSNPHLSPRCSQAAPSGHRHASTHTNTRVRPFQRQIVVTTTPQLIGGASERCSGRSLPLRRL